MVTAQQLEQLTSKAREAATERKFAQSFELLVGLKDIDLKKKELNINEVVFLPHPPSEQTSVCLFATGDLAVRAKKAGAEGIVEPAELDKLGGDKKLAKKLARQYGLFLADTTLMPRIGRILGPFLGPRGKMPAPVPANAPLEAMLARYKTAVRVRSRGQLAVTCKIGDEKMKDSQIAENAMAVLSSVEKKLPSGADNLKRVGIKLTMSPPAFTSLQEG